MDKIKGNGLIIVIIHVHYNIRCLTSYKLYSEYVAIQYYRDAASYVSSYLTFNQR